MLPGVTSGTAFLAFLFGVEVLVTMVVFISDSVTRNGYASESLGNGAYRNRYSSVIVSSFN